MPISEKVAVADITWLRITVNIRL